MTDLIVKFKDQEIPSQHRPKKILTELTGEISVSSYRTCHTYDYFEWKPQMKKQIAASIHNHLYGNFQHELAKAQAIIRSMYEVNYLTVDKLFADLRNSIPKITYD